MAREHTETSPASADELLWVSPEQDSPQGGVPRLAPRPRTQRSGRGTQRTERGGRGRLCFVPLLGARPVLSLVRLWSEPLTPVSRLLQRPLTAPGPTRARRRASISTVTAQDPPALPLASAQPPAQGLNPCGTGMFLLLPARRALGPDPSAAQHSSGPGGRGPLLPAVGLPAASSFSAPLRDYSQPFSARARRGPQALLSRRPSEGNSHSFQALFTAACFWTFIFTAFLLRATVHLREGPPTPHTAFFQGCLLAWGNGFCFLEESAVKRCRKALTCLYPLRLQLLEASGVFIADNF